MSEQAIRDALAAGGITGITEKHDSAWMAIGDTVMLNSGRPVWGRVASCGHTPNARYIAACNPPAITALLAQLDAARARVGELERNRDMWKEQCHRQARQLEALRMTDARRADLFAAALYISARDDDTAVLKCDDAERIAELLLDMSGIDLEAAMQAGKADSGESGTLGGKGAA